MTEVFERVPASETIVVMAMVNRETRQLAKDLGYTWDPDNHNGWIKRIKKANYALEQRRAAGRNVHIIIVNQ